MFRLDDALSKEISLMEIIAGPAMQF